MSAELYSAFVDVRGGKLEEFNRDDFQRALRAYSGPAELILRRPRRNDRRNRRLHAVLGEVAEALGWEADEFKEFIVTKLRPLEEDPATGWVRRQRTHKMTDQEIDLLVADIVSWTHEQMPGFRFREDAA